MSEMLVIEKVINIKYVSSLHENLPLLHPGHLSARILVKEFLSKSESFGGNFNHLVVWCVLG